MLSRKKEVIDEFDEYLRCILFLSVRSWSRYEPHSVLPLGISAFCRYAAETPPPGGKHVLLVNVSRMQE